MSMFRSRQQIKSCLLLLLSLSMFGCNEPTGIESKNLGNYVNQRFSLSLSAAKITHFFIDVEVDTTHTGGTINICEHEDLLEHCAAEHGVAVLVPPATLQLLNGAVGENIKGKWVVRLKQPITDLQLKKLGGSIEQAFQDFIYQKTEQQIKDRLGVGR